MIDRARASEAIKSMVDLLRPGAERIEVVGSYRRGAEHMKDVELLVEPKFADMFGPCEPRDDASQITGIIGLAIDKGILQARRNKDGHVIGAKGPRFFAVALHGIPVDIFVVIPPAQWGVLKLIRTGPAEFSQKLVTQVSKGGLLPSHLRCREGAIVKQSGDVAGHFPDEESVFALLGIDFIKPEDRR